jgi:hypothetical protein
LPPVDAAPAAHPVERLDLRRLSLATPNVVRKAFDRVPFDRALALLARVDSDTRQTLIEKLQLKAPVRERLERELAQLPPDPKAD